jgi:hypothetical protein
MPHSSDHTDAVDVVDVVLVDGRHLQVRAEIANGVRGVDADGDLLVPLLPDTTIRREDGAELLYPLTPCCQASGKGAETSTGVMCRACYREVDVKYGGPSRIAVARA